MPRPALISSGVRQPARFGPAVLAGRPHEAVARGARAVAVAVVPAPVAEAREAVPAAVLPQVSTLSRAAAPVPEASRTAVAMEVPAPVGFAAASSAKLVAALLALDLARAVVAVKVRQRSAARVPAAVMARPELRPLGQPETPSRPTPVLRRSAMSRCQSGRAAQPTPSHEWQANRPAIDEPAPDGCWASDFARVPLATRVRSSWPRGPDHPWTETV